MVCCRDLVIAVLGVAVGAQIARSQRYYNPLENKYVFIVQLL